MKIIYLLIGILLMSSCSKSFIEGPFTYTGEVVSKYHEDAKSEMTYHYGYSVMRGKICWHWGRENIPEKNMISYEFLGDTLETNNSDLYKAVSDSVKILYNRSYLIHKKDTVFNRNIIIEVIPNHN